MKRRTAILFTILAIAACSCGGRGGQGVPGNTEDFYHNPLFPSGSSPFLIRHGDSYYYTQTMGDHISIWKSDDIFTLSSSPEHIVYAPGEMFHISSPQLHLIDGVWYLYFHSDDGTEAVRHLYVMSNGNEDPTEGSFRLIGWIRTGNLKDIHPTTFTHRGERYLLWSGSNSQPSDDIVWWHIYIAKMDTPWSISSPAAIISTPQHVWERQWIDDDGSSLPTPTMVNEAPAFICSRDSTRLLIYYSASETYTSYYCVGMLSAQADSDLLLPSSWHKAPEPVFRKCERTGVLSPGHISFFPDGERLYILYQGKSRFPDARSVDNRSPRMQPAQWGPDGIPVLGFPVAEDSLLLKPGLH